MQRAGGVLRPHFHAAPGAGATCSMQCAGGVLRPHFHAAAGAGATCRMQRAGAPSEPTSSSGRQTRWWRPAGAAVRLSPSTTTVHWRRRKGGGQGERSQARVCCSKLHTVPQYP